ncbi:hypothetical protein LZ32DRAFT_623676 [Colletotrichum eremochloae]|nr:hypothetical protein LZ32DRAFT_623676 [Colletotrichum eremochloae]
MHKLKRGLFLAYLYYSLSSLIINYPYNNKLIEKYSRKEREIKLYKVKIIIRTKNITNKLIKPTIRNPNNNTLITPIKILLYLLTLALRLRYKIDELSYKEKTIKLYLAKFSKITY